MRKLNPAQQEALDGALEAIEASKRGEQHPRLFRMKDRAEEMRNRVAAAQAAAEQVETDEADWVLDLELEADAWRYGSARKPGT